jgi:DNA-binding response OmpR family regulator/DNA-binding CsgD family transcriptional regulator
MSTLLVVDDVPANLALLIDAAGSAGHRVLIAEDGERALKLANKVIPDLILLDVSMPGASGFEICRQLRATPATSEIPVIFITAHSEVSDKVTGLSAGGVDYVTKPIQAAEVLARVQVHLEISRLRKELQTAVARRDEAVRALRHSLDRALVVATLDGQILFSTVRAGRVLTEHFGSGGDILPPELLACVGTESAKGPLEIAVNGARLRVRQFSEVGEAECVTLLIEPQLDDSARLQRRFSLTQREAEVLFWIAQGKSNPEIAAILANTTGTVKKQVASILSKLEVENRMSAGLKAHECLEQPPKESLGAGVE